MKNLFDISKIDKGIIQFTYLFLIFLSLFFSGFLLFKGLSDPFGELLIISGIVSLILFPLLLKIIFSIIFSFLSHDKP